MVEIIDSSHQDILNQSPPERHLDRIHFLARALAFGAMLNMWSPGILVTSEPNEIGVPTETWRTSGHGYTGQLPGYLQETWSNRQPQATFLESFGYLVRQTPITEQPIHYLLTPAAFALLERPVGRRVFISYRRAESSAFALLLMDRLERDGFDVFVDMQDITPGEHWRKRLLQEVVERDVFISLLGPTTLESDIVRLEIQWAGTKTSGALIPVWHNGFRPEAVTFGEIAELLQQRDAVIVQQEDILAYNAAYQRLLQYLRSINPRT